MHIRNCKNSILFKSNPYYHQIVADTNAALTQLPSCLHGINAQTNTLRILGPLFFRKSPSSPIGFPEAGTARSLPQSRMASILSGLVCDNGITLLNAVTMFSSLRIKLLFAFER